MEGREREGTGGPRNIHRAGEGEGQAGTAPAGSPGSALVACLSPGPGALGRDPSDPSPAACARSLGVVVEAGLQKDSVGVSEPTEGLLPPGAFPRATPKSVSPSATASGSNPWPVSWRPGHGVSLGPSLA